MRYHGRFEKKLPKKKRGKKIFLTVFALLLVLIIGIVAAGLFYYDSILDRVTIVEVPKATYANQGAAETTLPSLATAATTAGTTAVETTPPTTVPVHVPSSEDYINILLVGQASREGEEERFADTMLLCTLNTHEKTLTVTSFLRDAFAKMPDYRGRTGGRIKLTTIYHLGSVYGDGVAGSMELMNQALYDNFGVEVDYNFEIDFEAFSKMVDLLGGLDVELSQAEADYMNDLDDREGAVIQDCFEGHNTLDGYSALHYVRMRKAEGDADSDIARTARQRSAINTIITDLMHCSVSELNNMANQILPLITTSMTKDEINDMMMLVIPMLPSLEIRFDGTCPVAGTGWGEMVDIYGDGMMHSVIRFNAEEQKRLMREITEGEIAQ